jgi:hypothetical protein
VLAPNLVARARQAFTQRTKPLVTWFNKPHYLIVTWFNPSIDNYH